MLYRWFEKLCWAQQGIEEQSIIGNLNLSWTTRSIRNSVHISMDLLRWLSEWKPWPTCWSHQLIRLFTPSAIYLSWNMISIQMLSEEHELHVQPAVVLVLTQMSDGTSEILNLWCCKNLRTWILLGRTLYPSQEISLFSPSIEDMASVIREGI